MASISNDANGTRRLQYTDVDGERKSIRLGKIAKKDAHAVQLRVEELLSCKHCGTSPDRTTLQWVASISVKLRTKLAHHKLVDVGNLPTKTKKVGLKEFLDAYIEKRSAGKKPATVSSWRQIAKSLEDGLPPDISIQDVNAGHASDWLDAMRAKQSAISSVSLRVTVAKQFFGYAVDHKLIKSNPFESLKAPTARTTSNVEVTRETVAAVLKVCDPVWKAIIVLSRYGGMRCPSEVLTLKWADVDFEAGRVTIRAPKNERHAGKGVRQCPLFPEVRAAIESLPRVGEYVINKPSMRKSAEAGRGWAAVGMRNPFLSLLKKANVTPWPRGFHSMRATRQTELEQEYGLPAACAWLGNTESVAKEHYLLVFEKDWERAAGKKSVS